MPHKLTVEDLEMLNDLVQDALIEVVSIDAAREPSYRIASRFRGDDRRVHRCMLMGYDRAESSSCVRQES